MLAPQLAGLVGAKAQATAPAGDESRLILNATCIMGGRRLAIINGKTYAPNDPVIV